jgi:uncharacterized protein
MVVPVNPEVTLDELIAQSARAQLYVTSIHRTDRWNRDGPEFPELLRAHLSYLYELQADGTLFGAGPLEPGDDDLPMGMIIIAAASKEAAQAIVEREPFHEAGWRINTVRGWTLNEGCAALFGKMLAELAALRPVE